MGECAFGFTCCQEERLGCDHILGGDEDVRKIFEELLLDYNDQVNVKPMPLVLFEMALEHLVRIYRIIRLPQGNALLVGIGGSGKRSAGGL